MNPFKHSYNDLQKSTGLDPNFIRRLSRSVPELKRAHTENGSSGELLFDDNAVILLQQAAEMRADKRPFKLIARTIADAIKPQPPPVTNEPEDEQQDLVKEMFLELKRSHDVALKSKQEIIDSKQELIDDQKQRLLLLTDGRDPAEVRREREQEQARLMQLERDKAEAEQRAKQARSEAENAALTARDLMLSATAKEEALEREQARLKAELESKQAESQALEQAARERATKRAMLLDQLDQLSWFQWGRKRDLLTQIRELD